jgi:hypothetical protein
MLDDMSPVGQRGEKADDVFFVGQFHITFRLMGVGESVA